MLPYQDPLRCLAVFHQTACPEARMTGRRGCSSAPHHPCSCPPDWVRMGRQRCWSPVLHCSSCLPGWSPAEMRIAEVRGLVPLHTSDQPKPMASNTAFSACRSLCRLPRLDIPTQRRCIQRMHAQVSRDSFAADSKCMQSTDDATSSKDRECS
jgi:hypothetical protein